MSTSATEGQGQAPADQGTGQGQAPAGTGDQGQAPGDQGGAAGAGDFDPSTITDPAVKAYVDKLAANVTRANSEAAQHRVKANETQTALQTLQQQHETDAQRTEREAQEATARTAQEATRVAELEAQVQRLQIGTAVDTAAREARAINPVLVAQMLTPTITLGDDGKPSNLAEALAALKTSDPYLFRRTSNDAGAGGGAGESPQGNMNDTIRAQLAARRGRG